MCFYYIIFSDLHTHIVSNFASCDTNLLWDIYIYIYIYISRIVRERNVCCEERIIEIDTLTKRIKIFISPPLILYNPALPPPGLGFKGIY